MIAFPGMLVEAAEKAGMKVPADPDDYDGHEFPHFHVFCLSQLCRPVKFHGEHWENAKIIASIPDKDITKITFEKLDEMGFSR